MFAPIPATEATFSMIFFSEYHIAPIPIIINTLFHYSGISHAPPVQATDAVVSISIKVGLSSLFQLISEALYPL